MPRTFLTVDLGFGDAGKGSVVDWLVRAHDAHTVVRYNGGAQAGHRVVTADGREHVFSQFGSGTLAGARTHLSRFMLLEPLAMMAEEQHLRAIGVPDVWECTTIDARALVITPFQRAANRLRELARGAARHGSCGLGIGETMVDALAHGEEVLHAGDLAHPDRLRAKLRFLRTVNRTKVAVLAGNLLDNEAVAAERVWLDDEGEDEWLMDRYQAFTAQARIVAEGHLPALLRQLGTVVFEAAQGVLLDEWGGFHPHTTWGTTTLANADTLLAEAGYSGDVTRLGITRAYATRHGAGPFVTEDATLTNMLPDPCNSAHPWQQGFRVGWPDLVMLRYARALVGPLDALAVTCLDRLAALPNLTVCSQYDCQGETLATLSLAPQPRDLVYQEGLTRILSHCHPILEPVADPNALLKHLAEASGAPVRLISEGPTAEDKKIVNGE